MDLTGFADSLNFLKLERLIQLVDVVLSVMESAQSPMERRFVNMSTHGVIIDTMSWSKLLDAQKRRCGGMAKHQA